MRSMIGNARYRRFRRKNVAGPHALILGSPGRGWVGLIVAYDIVRSVASVTDSRRPPEALRPASRRHCRRPASAPHPWHQSSSDRPVGQLDGRQLGDLPVDPERARPAPAGARRRGARAEKKGLWAAQATLLAYEYRAMEKRHTITKKIVAHARPGAGRAGDHAQAGMQVRPASKRHS